MADGEIKNSGVGYCYHRNSHRKSYFIFHLCNPPRVKTDATKWKFTNMMWHVMIFDALLCNLIGKQQKKQNRQREKVTAPISHGSPESNRSKWWGQDKHAPEMQQTLRRMKEWTWIKNVDWNTFDLRKRHIAEKREKKRRHRAGAEVTICQVFSRCTQSQKHIACTYAQSLPHMDSLLLQALLSVCLCSFQIFCWN